MAAHGALLLVQAQALDAELDKRCGDPSGLVRVATSPVMALLLLLLLLPGLGLLLDRHPRLRVESWFATGSLATAPARC